MDITTALDRSDPAVVRTVAVAFCNLDRFKTVNDAYGHGVGDEVLRVVAHRFRVGLRPCDEVGRFGSDEFVVCSTIAGNDTVDALVDRIQDVFRSPVMIDTTEARLTATVGVAVANPGALACDCDAMLRDAITAMHDAKRRGIPTGHFQHEMRADVVRRADLEQQLAAAVGRGDIVAHYQPIVDLETCEVVGFEALARWRQGTSFIPAATWISVAEATDLVDEMGEQLLLAAARQTEHWRKNGHDVTINVNVSARQLGGPRLEAAVTTALGIIPAARVLPRNDREPGSQRDGSGHDQGTQPARCPDLARRLRDRLQRSGGRRPVAHQPDQDRQVDHEQDRHQTDAP